MKHNLVRLSQRYATAMRRVKREIVQRKFAEKSLKQSEQHYGQLLAQSRQMQDDLRLLSRQLLSVQEEERKQISRELHDVIGQTLTGINVQLAALRKEAAFNSESLEPSIVRTQQFVQQSVDVVHRFARELRPAVLDDLGLIPAIHTFMKSFREHTGIQVSLSAFAAVERVNGDKRTVLYRVAQEALTNVGRHAEATKAEVKIDELDGSICLKIKDNGKGFQNQGLARRKRGKRLGLLGMRERVEMLGGHLSVTSVPGKGTTVQARIPRANGARNGGGKTRRARSGMAKFD